MAAANLACGMPCCLECHVVNCPAGAAWPATATHGCCSEPHLISECSSHCTPPHHRVPMQQSSPTLSCTARRVCASGHPQPSVAKGATCYSPILCSKRWSAWGSDQASAQRWDGQCQQLNRMLAYPCG